MALRRDQQSADCDDRYRVSLSRQVSTILVIYFSSSMFYSLLDSVSHQNYTYAILAMFSLHYICHMQDLYSPMTYVPVYHSLTLYVKKRLTSYASHVFHVALTSRHVTSHVTRFTSHYSRHVSQLTSHVTRVTSRQSRDSSTSSPTSDGWAGVLPAVLSAVSAAVLTALAPSAASAAVTAVTSTVL